MQRGACRVMNESHLSTIALKARLDNKECGYLWRRTVETGFKWQAPKWYALYQNLLFFYENVNSTKPLGLFLLESSFCHRLITNVKNTKAGDIKLFCFSISFSKNDKNPIEFGAESEQECIQWIGSIENSSYNKQTFLNTELQQKYEHLAKMYDTESIAKWEATTHLEYVSGELKRLQEELKACKREYYVLQTNVCSQEESVELKRIKKVQSLCRGWLYRKRWKRIVKEYIESPHATSLRSRNRLVFELVEKEGEYTQQLELLVGHFLIPLRMAACSSKPPITHEEINCIFLNSEILLFLHQIFYKGLCRKMDKWPTLFIGDLFDFLLPVLAIYQEYVRNHHYSLQILTELKSKSADFRNLLKRLENKDKCEGRSLDVILTYPMHQIPRYIILLHQLIAQTNKNSVSELNSLENAKNKLEQLSSTMRNEVSETENIRCNLAIEKMIVEGCECLLDTNQLFINEGLLIVYTQPKTKNSKRNVVKCFLFTNHLVVTKRASNGRLNLFMLIPLAECKLVEEITAETEQNEEESMTDDYSSMISIVSSEANSFFKNRSNENDIRYEFKLVQSSQSTILHIHFIASSASEKQSWCSDLNNCIDNLNLTSVLQNTNKSNSINMPNTSMHINDPKLFNDEKDVTYCKTFSSCKVPQIRHATKEILLQRLVDLRFLSIDFLNTFLLTYRVFTDAIEVLKVLKNIYESSPKSSIDLQNCDKLTYNSSSNYNELNRRVSLMTTNKLMPIITEEPTPISQKKYYYNNSLRRAIYPDLAIKTNEISNQINHNNNRPERSDETDAIQVSDTTFQLLQSISISAPLAISEGSSNFSIANSVELLPKANHNSRNRIKKILYSNVSDGIGISTSPRANSNTLASMFVEGYHQYQTTNSRHYEFPQSFQNHIDEKDDFESDCISLNDSISSASNTAMKIGCWNNSNNNCNYQWRDDITNNSISNRTEIAAQVDHDKVATSRSNLHSDCIFTNYNLILTNQQIDKNSNDGFEVFLTKQQNEQYKPIDPVQHPQQLGSPVSKPAKGAVTACNYSGVVVTSSRFSRRRISNCNALKLFAIATSGSQNSLETSHTTKRNGNILNNNQTKSNNSEADHFEINQKVGHTNSSIPLNRQNKSTSNAEWLIVNAAAFMRVLNVIRHWVAKHPMDFIENTKLKEETLSLLNKMLGDRTIRETEKKVAESIIKQLNLPIEVFTNMKSDVELLLGVPSRTNSVKFSDLSVSEIAEQMTYIDYQIFCSIQSQELLGEAWMKPGKEDKAKNVLLFSKRFNEMSQLVVTEILNSCDLEERVGKLEKWTTIANICRFLKNFNGVLQIISAFSSTSVFRLKKTWENLSKNSQQTFDCLQNLVSSDGRFKKLRDAMYKCDPPIIPYLGMYLMDLVFIEESTPDTINTNLVNFSKLRMVSHIIRDIQTLQHSKYTIHYNKRVCDYLFNTSNLLSNDETWKLSLEIEPKIEIDLRKSVMNRCNAQKKFQLDTSFSA